MQPEQHHSNVEAIKSVFDSALSEDVGEIEQLSSGQPAAGVEAAAAPKKGRAAFKRRFYLTIGAIVLALAVIGLVSTVSFTVRLGRSIIENTAAKNAFAEFIYPVVIIDPPPFEDTDQLPNTTMLSAAIWNIILDEQKKSRYATEGGMMTVPEVDVEASATELFGPGLTFNHQTLGDIELFFTYDSTTRSYTVPVSPRYLPYSPNVETIARDGDTYTLLVGYLPPGPAWLKSTTDYTATAVKHMEYVLKKNGGDYTIVAINDKSASDGQSS